MEAAWLDISERRVFEMGRPTILTLTAPSATGKGMVSKALLGTLPNACMVSSVTTRNPRPTDTLENEYHYVSLKNFARFQDLNWFLWDVEKDENWYGTLRSDVHDICMSPDAIGIMHLVPERVGTLIKHVHGHYSNPISIVSVFLVPPEEALLRERMRERGDRPESIDRRIKEEQGWLAAAKASEIPFHFIDGGREPSEIPRVLVEILAALEA